MSGKDSPALLTQEERVHWDSNGYLQIKSVLTDAEVMELREAVDGLSSHFSRLPISERRRYLGLSGNQRDLMVKQAISFTPAIDRLLDHPGVFGRLLGLMGPYLQVVGTEAFVRYPHPGALLRLHTDGGPGFRRFLPHADEPVLQLKVQFFLTDVAGPDSGNMVVVPGSHRRRFPDGGPDAAAGPRRQILAAAGDALVFPWSLWHAVAPNLSGQIRRSVIIRYAQLWCRPQDYARLDDETLSRMSPRRRLLLGVLPGNDGQYDDLYRYYLPPSGEHVRVMYGAEWSDSVEAAEYAATEAAVRSGYSAKTRGGSGLR
ncbi:phytanoyl-CoA dioxygenase family protein [Actinomadura fulvescens]|uniref:Fe2OG dioxygenase domain-containing protein n=1 Tax=Actinomadura fulvescens TaxID=46160 RepID=A0ABN3Q292_9ACTN